LKYKCESRFFIGNKSGNLLQRSRYMIHILTSD
jgi:hypothetical protein